MNLSSSLNRGVIDIDVFLSESAFQKSILQRRSQHDVGGKLVWLVSPEDLILLKALANRDRDRGDIQDVLFMQGELDREYISHWAERLGASQTLEESLKKFDESAGV